MNALHKMVNGVIVELTVEESAKIEAEWAANAKEKAEYDNYYVTKRLQEYPKIEEQLDMMFHDIESTGTIAKGEWFTAIKAIKDAYPKV